MVALLGSAKPSTIPAYLAPYVAQHDFSGVVYVTAPEGNVYREAVGPGNTFATAFAIGSISKTFTAAAVEILASRGRLLYDDTLARFVPEYRYANEVTIRELLAHSAGIPDFYSIPAFASVREENLPLQQIVRWLNAYPLDFKPGTKSSYSNSGYSLLALVIERASGESYDRFLARNIFEPLVLSHTFDGGSAPQGDVAPGFDPGPPPTYLQPAAAIGEGWFTGNGSIRSNASDLARWLDVAAKGTFANFASLPYPYGWSRKAGSAVLEQDGRIAGYAADISIDEQSGLKVVVLSDIQCAAASTIAGAIRAAQTGAGLVPPALRPHYLPNAEQLNNAVGSYGFPGLPLVVSANGRQLFLNNANDGMVLALDAIGPNEFFFRPLYVFVRFKADASGTVQAIDWGGEFTIPRVRAAPRETPRVAFP